MNSDETINHGESMSDRDWLVPCAGLTIASGAVALWFMPDRSGMMPALKLLPMWMMVAAIMAAFCGPTGLFPMMMAGVKSPLRHLVDSALNRWRVGLLIALGMGLAGLNMVTFMWTKPLLNHLVPFWSDPLLARIDHILFFGIDPWRLLSWMNNVPTALFYHRGWFAMMIATLLLVLSRPPSAQKSALLLAYFLLWSVFGPVVHILLPAGGPVFFDDLGYGPRFNGIFQPGEMQEMSAYLWSTYVAGGFGPGSGISAMPSLHIATTGWMLLAVRTLAPRWTVAMAALGLLIFLLSISLGWHYAADGIVGAAGAYGAYRLSLRWLARDRTWLRRREPGPVRA